MQGFFSQTTAHDQPRQLAQIPAHRRMFSQFATTLHQFGVYFSGHDQRRENRFAVQSDR